jgi:hypothetical protein
MQVRGSVALVMGSNRGMVESLLAHGADRIYATTRHDSDFDAIVALDRHRVIAH